MRTGVAGLAVAAAALGAMVAISPAASADPILSATALRAKTDQYLFSISIGTFLTNRGYKYYITQLDWSSDGCSTPGLKVNKPGGFNFLPSCQRHDFGYRNYKKQSRFSEPNRARIDSNFKKDMYNVCNGYSGLLSALGVACRRYADVYYNGVRIFGNASAPADGSPTAPPTAPVTDGDIRVDATEMAAVDLEMAAALAELGMTPDEVEAAGTPVE
ncbi:hypothetical protein Psi02_76700 [Planotetraspora silvatica]|uniref:Phospholipase n=2 Tax=Planotetraspora silvatica TaxID=234614 RepID=A0A8J3XT64_9ACTN|nr:hypothetical protein Psi02_76700 [Planotetraspora silvatica]